MKRNTDIIKSSKFVIEQHKELIKHVKSVSRPAGLLLLLLIAKLLHDYVFS